MAPIKQKPWDDLARKGPRLRALCFGINTYTHLDKLSNCERDAKTMAERVNGLSGCRATVCTSAKLKDKEAMMKEVRAFVASIDKEAPPRMVLVSHSGHAIQDGDKVLLAPSGASNEPNQLKQDCLSHDELFSILYEEMHKKIPQTDTPSSG